MSNKNKQLPFVSICTPTYNRRPFIPYIIECFLRQDYPLSRMEWIIVDDGTDSVEDLIKSFNIKQIKYYRVKEKLPLGKKRNLMHTFTKGDIIVYMDDDDYYPPERVSHAVERLMSDPNVIAAGASKLYTYFKHINKMIQFGPYHQNHATAGTFAFKRKLIEISKYDDNACMAEEQEFLKNYTIPFIQLDPMKAILVLSHSHNTFDKKKLLDQIGTQFVNETTVKVDDFLKDEKLKEFYLNVDLNIKDYQPGSIENKQDVIVYMKKLEEDRKKMEFHINIHNETTNTTKTLYGNEIVEYIRSLVGDVQRLNQELEMKNNEIKYLRKIQSTYQDSVYKKIESEKQEIEIEKNPEKFLEKFIEKKTEKKLLLTTNLYITK
jgi:glycosyltransferase involved in cell wall biosynthesis